MCRYFEKFLRKLHPWIMSSSCSKTKFYLRSCSCRLWLILKCKQKQQKKCFREKRVNVMNKNSIHGAFSVFMQYFFISKGEWVEIDVVCGCLCQRWHDRWFSFNMQNNLRAEQQKLLESIQICFCTLILFSWRVDCHMKIFSCVSYFWKACRRKIRKALTWVDNTLAEPNIRHTL